MYSIDLFSKTSYSPQTALLDSKNQTSIVGIVNGEQDIFKDNDLFAKYTIDFDPPSEGKTHFEIGKDLASKGYELIKMSLRILELSPPLSSLLGTGGAIMFGGGIVMMSVGLIERFQEKSNLLSQTRESAFHVMDPKDLDLSGSMRSRNSDGGPHLEGYEERNFNDIQKSIKDMQRDFQKPMLERSGEGIRGFDGDRGTGFGGLADGRSLGERPSRDTSKDVRDVDFGRDSGFGGIA